MAMDRAASSKDPGRPRLVLVTPAIDDAAAFAPLLAAACSARDVAAIILRLAPGDDETQIGRVREIASALTGSGPILMLDGHANIVTRTAADGVHLNGSAQVSPMRRTLREERTIGAGALHSRHDAMTAAENGADYVMFGEPDADGRRPGLPAVVERVEWWAELFVIPCVAYVVDLDEMEDLIAAGADFIALGEEAVWKAPQGAPRALAAARVHLAVAEPAE